jgi:hypothetical protein
MFVGIRCARKLWPNRWRKNDRGWSRRCALASASKPNVKVAPAAALIIAWLPVRVLPAPPRSPAQRRFRAAVVIVFNFSWLCRRRRGKARSLSCAIDWCRPKCRPSLWPRQTLSRRNFRSRAETGSNVGREPTRTWESRRRSRPAAKCSVFSSQRRSLA